VLFRLSESPGSIRWAGGPHGANTDEVLAEIGVTPDQLDALRAAGVV
jgi:crotonobetainyl-CoA:carnitine CoA-transferase CaiB-like acyl-CoA transferase